jgi:hypothetical protein
MKIRDRAKKKGRLMNIDAKNPNAITAFTIAEAHSKSLGQYRSLSQSGQSKRSKCGDTAGKSS